MKLAYLNVIYSILPGVTSKIESQALALKSIDSQSKIVCFYCDNDNSLDTTNKCLTYVKLPKPVRSAQLFRKLYNFQLTQFIFDYTTNNRFDVVILRSIALSPLFWYYFRSKKYKLITEHHTKIVPEMMIKKSYLGAASTILSRGIIDSVIDGKICVTREIANYEAFNKPIRVIPNGHNAVQKTSFLPYNGKTVRLVMLCSVSQPWHGITRLFASMISWQRDRSDIQFYVDIIGNIQTSEFVSQNLPNNVVFHGYKDANDIAIIMSHANIGVSSIALYLKNMQEACSLKSREYIGRGMPFICGYYDPDILETDSYILRVPNDGSIIEVSVLLEFLQYLNRHREKVTFELDAAARRISWESKMKDYYDFAKSIYLE
ncbi:glycosyltransferase family 4 protein [Cylindrospermopsis raciborskii]|uniref:glycosyltransferase family 4 protein n=1 Tax=Cylindrospermopsis raciborskii TaxID=77022 RepID=UPI0008DC802B|nr:glycosyltransferase family 4 protein [Cylindrospermopsis raciborskii]NLQ06422.1 glycosyltransferase family 4 protein [Cylindrospermopsis raciborskii MVCC19]OHY34139.1 hypothetical protein BCV64_06840 [Cylindrospermopsis raciborskii MVCC14]